MKGKTLFLLLFYIVFIDVHANDLPVDTVNIDVVEITANRVSHYTKAYRQDNFSGEGLYRYEATTVGELIRQQTPLNIKSYGTPGSAATLSLRGAVASHTQVNWNGFPINSITMGEMDLSMVPTGGFDHVTLIYGASGALFGSGTFGGAVNLENNTERVSDKPLLRFYAEAGSLNTHKTGVNLNAGKSKVYYSGNVWGAVSDGDFKYYDYIRKGDFKRTNAGWSNYGTIQHIRFQVDPKNTIDGGVWCQSKKINLPNIVGAQLENHEKQEDATLKLFARYRRKSGLSALEIKTAYFYDYQLYTDKESLDAEEYSIHSKIISRKVYADANYRYFLSEHYSFDVGATYSLLTADVDAYAKTKQEHNIAAIAGFTARFPKFRPNLVARYEWNSEYDARFLISAGAVYNLIPEKVSIRGNVSQKYRKPTFNDRYWMPYGNENLKAEDGISGEIGVQIVCPIVGKKHQLLLDVAGYVSKVNNMIMWQTSYTDTLKRGKEAKLSPENYLEVLMRGVETKMMYTGEWNDFKLAVQFSTVLNKSTIKKTADGNDRYNGHRLYYTPLLSVMWNTNITYKKIGIQVVEQLTSNRYFAENRKLPSYRTTNLKVYRHFKLDKARLTASISAENIWNEEYELIRSYPMPGRMVAVKIAFTY